MATSTHNEISAEYLAILRNLTPAQRWETGRKLYWQARDIRAAAIRMHHPDWNEERIAEAVRKQFLYARE